MAEEEGTQQLAFVRETVLKKRKVNEDWAIKNRERKAAKRQRRRNDARGAIKRPEEFVREFRNKELDLMRMRTRLKVRRLRPAEKIDAKLLFAIRIPGTTDVHPDIRRILAKLRLTQVLTGVFLKATEANLKRLAAVDLFVTYGFPNLKNVKELIYKKGRGFFDKEPFPLTSNDLIEKALGDHGVICLEDVVHEISTVGPHFRETSSFLMPFKLKCPERRLQMKKKPFKALGDHGVICLEDVVHEISTVGPHFRETSSFLMPFKLKCPERRLQMKKKPFKAGGDTGNRGDKINELIEKLN